MSSLDELRSQIDDSLRRGISVSSGVSLIKVVPDRAIMSIFKHGGLVSAEDVPNYDVNSLAAKIQADVNKLHPQLNNVIYATAALTKNALDPLPIAQAYGKINVIIKPSVLNRPNTTFTVGDTGLSLKNNQNIQFYKSELLTESELIKHNQNRSLAYVEVQIRGKVSLAEIEAIVYQGRAPLQTEIDLANQNNIPIYHNYKLVGAALPSNYDTVNNVQNSPRLPNDISLSAPILFSPIEDTPRLPDFSNIPKTLPPVDPPPALEPSDPMPPNKIPNFTEFKSFDAAEEWLRNGKDLEVNFPPKSFPPALENAANAGNSGIWHKGIRYSNF